MVDVVQLVRASDCGSECRRFESGLPPNKNPCKLSTYEGFLFVGSGYLESEIMLNMAQSENLGDCVKILIFAS